MSWFLLTVILSKPSLSSYILFFPLEILHCVTARLNFILHLLALHYRLKYCSYKNYSPCKTWVSNLVQWLVYHFMKDNRLREMKTSDDELDTRRISVCILYDMCVLLCRPKGVGYITMPSVCVTETSESPWVISFLCCLHSHLWGSRDRPINGGGVNCHLAGC